MAAATCLVASNAAAFAYFTPLNSDPMFTVTTHDHPLGRIGVDITPLTPAGQANIKFTFAGASPITANGQTYNTGAVLYENTSWLGLVSPTNGTASFFGGGDSAFLPGSFAWGYIYGINYTTSGQGQSLTAALSNGYIGYAVPEPTTWALLIVGFGLTGTALRRRRYARVIA